MMPHALAQRPAASIEFHWFIRQLANDRRQLDVASGHNDNAPASDVAAPREPGG